MTSESDRPSDTAQDPILAAAWRTQPRESPSPTLDAAILAAAHRAVGSAPHPAGSEALRPPRWWLPFAATAVIGVVAVGLVQLASRDVLDVTTPPAAPQPVPAAAPIPAPVGAVPSPPPAAVAPAVAPAAGLAAPPVPAAPPPPSTDARSTRSDATTTPRATIDTGAGSALRAEPSGRMSGPAEKARSEAAAPAPAPAAPTSTEASEPAPAAAPLPAAPVMQRDAASASAGAAPLAKRAPSTLTRGEAIDLARDPAAWITRIGRLHAAGRDAEALAELREFDALVPDARQRLPAELRQLLERPQ